jgi:CBS domain-containing protein
MITIGDVIREREPYFVRDTATAHDAAQYMTERNIGAVCVLDAAQVPIRDVMSAIDVVIDCTDTPHQALERMEQFGTRHLPVVRGTRWVGMLSIRDIMRVELSEQGDELRLLHEYIQH